MNTALTTLTASARAAALSLALLSPAIAKTERDPGVMREFMRIHPCPAGPDQGSHKRCSGYQKDHIVPLECSGVDAVENLQWLTLKEHAAKTRQDNLECHPRYRRAK